VVSVILQNIKQRSPDLERCAKRARVVPIGKDRSAATDASIQATGQAHREPLHRARKRALSVCLYDEMQMVRLDRKLHESRPEALFCRAERRKHERSECSLPKAWKPSADLHRHVQRKASLEFRTTDMRHARLCTSGLSACPSSSTAARPECESELS